MVVSLTNAAQAVADAVKARKTRGPKPAKRVKVAPAPSRISVAPLDRLKRSLSVYEFQAADEIVHAYRIAIGAPPARDIDLGIPMDARPDAADDAAARRLDVSVKYQRWRQDLNETPFLAAAMATLIAEEPLRDTDRAYSWRNGMAKRHLVVALRHFAALRGNTPRDCQGWKWRRPKSELSK